VLVNEEKINFGIFDYLNDCQLLEKDSALWGLLQMGDESKGESCVATSGKAVEIRQPFIKSSKVILDPLKKEVIWLFLMILSCYKH
jgi:hypothetical protein